MLDTLPTVAAGLRDPALRVVVTGGGVNGKTPYGNEFFRWRRESNFVSFALVPAADPVLIPPPH